MAYFELVERKARPVTLWFEGGFRKDLEGFYFTVETEGRQIELAAHYSPAFIGLWDVTDPKTGFSVCKNFSTIEAAISEATEKLKKKGAAAYDAAVEKAAKFLAENCLPKESP